MCGYNSLRFSESSHAKSLYIRRGETMVAAEMPAPSLSKRTAKTCISYTHEW